MEKELKLRIIRGAYRRQRVIKLQKGNYGEPWSPAFWKAIVYQRKYMLPFIKLKTFVFIIVD